MSESSEFDPSEFEKALVIDDHLPTSEFIGEVLRACEIETYNTSDSKLAEGRLRREKFDVVFVDAKMPPPDGLELARRIRAAGPNKRATIVMITGEQGSHFMQHVFEAGHALAFAQQVFCEHAYAVGHALEGAGCYRRQDEAIRSLSSETDTAKRNAAIASTWKELSEETNYIALHHQTLAYAMKRELDIPVATDNTVHMKFVAAK